MADCLRRPNHRYHDPLALIWLRCAERIGFRVRRTPEVYASADGRGTISIGTDEILDPDDSLAQMIFHELCHALVEGEAGWRQPDWGLGNAVGKDPWREHACLRVQAYLADQVGLRRFFAPTTDFRVTFWDALPADPLATVDGDRRERSCVAARIALWRAERPPWAPHLKEALAASAALAAVVAPVAETAAPDPWPSLWTTADAPPPRHPAGHAPLAPYHGEHGCADCAWGFGDRRGWHCRHAPRLRLPREAPACTRWEPAAELNCETCAACCREAYQSVEVAAREPVNVRHPDLVVRAGRRRTLRRVGSRCAALAGDGGPAEPYRCTIYEDRPRSCRDFLRGGPHCLDARRRVGLSL